MPSRDVPRHSDPGLQPERTDLAWGRTALALVVAAAVFLRWMPHHGWFAGTLVVAAVLAALAISITRKRRLYRAISGIHREASSPGISAVAAMAGSVVSFAVLGICTVLLIPVGP